tara:strand:+ start:240 stop:932 length:693 start_codon:yes stop_codon:yes gene_type:complete
MTILYSNGCSFTGNNLVDRHRRYPLIVGQHFGWAVHDHALPGTCNTKIIRCTIRDCLGLLKNNEKITALIQLTFLERWEYAGDPDGANSWQYQDNDQFETIKSLDEKNWPSEIKNYVKQICVSQRSNALYAQLFSNLVGLICFFKTHKIDYCIFSGPDTLDKNVILQDSFYQYLKTDPNILSLTDFYMLALSGTENGKMSHPTQEGMQRIADFFIKLLGAMPVTPSAAPV